MLIVFIQTRVTSGTGNRQNLEPEPAQGDSRSLGAWGVRSHGGRGITPTRQPPTEPQPETGVGTGT